MNEVSVIISVSNDSIYFPTCFESVLNQNFQDLEIILVNNAENNIDKLIGQYCEKFNDVLVVNDLESAINEAGGKYISFIDSNDYLNEDMIEKLANASEKNDLDISMCQLTSHDDLTNEFDEDLHDLSLDILKGLEKDVFNRDDIIDVITRIYSKPFNKLFKSSFLKDNEIDFAENKFHDEIFFYDTILKADRISLVKDPLYVRRFNNRFIKGESYDDYTDILFAFRSIKEKLIAADCWQSCKVAVVNLYIKRIFHYFAITSDEHKEEFYNEFKKELEDLTHDEAIFSKLSAQHTLAISRILNSKDYSDYLKTSDKLISVIIPCYNAEDYIHETLDSVIGQTLDFRGNIELVLVDDGSQDDTLEICRRYEKKYPDNIKVIHQQNQGQATARNVGLQYATGKYVNFLDADDTLWKNTFSNVINFFEQHYSEIDLVAFPMYFFGRKTGNHLLNYKFKKTMVVNLDEYWDYPQLSASSAVFKRSLFDKFEFDTTLISSEDSVMVNKILLEKKAYGVVKEAGYNYRKRFDESSTIDTTIQDKEFFNGRLKGYFRELIDYSKEKVGYVPKFIQYLIVYDIQWILTSAEGIESLLDEKELAEFNQHLRYVLANIDDEVINFHFKEDPYKVRNHMYRIKYDGFTLSTENDQVSISVPGQKLDTLNDHIFYLDIVEIKNNTLYISGVLSSYFKSKDMDIVLVKTVDGTEEVFKSEIVSYSNRRESSYSESKLCFDFEVPVDSSENSTVKLQVRFHDHGRDIPIDLYVKFLNHARLSHFSTCAVWDDYLISFKDNTFFITKASYLKLLKYELRILLRLIYHRWPYWTSAFFFHLAYVILFPFYRNRKIWMVMDRKDMADDNAEHFYRYASKMEDGIDKYFTISEESKDFNRLSETFNNVIPYYSIKQRLLYIFADKIVSSQVDDENVNPFFGKHIQLYAGIANADKIFLQHGVIKDDMSNWLRKYDKNVQLLVTTADIEAESFKKYEYHYRDGIVQVLGLPRYDNLENNSKSKQILIMPSWRRNLIHLDNDQIAKSQYFLRFNSLINNERLIELAKSKGYKIIFKPHPNTFRFIELFKENDYVTIDSESKYQDLFNNSSLMITDYSSLAFDFAYIKKPLLYYQYGNDYHFGDQFFDYETMGFGEVIKDEDKLIDEIEEYLNNDCEMKDIYRERANKFYRYNDKNNCKRVYDAILKIK